MMKHILAALLMTVAFTACGGGGGESTPPVSNPAPTPIPIANTSLSFYVPLAQGNNWVFASGGKLQDMGSSNFSCNGCPAEGVMIEQIALFAPSSSSLSGSFFFTKNGALTNLLGVENDANTNNIIYVSNASYPYGVPVMDDNPTVNESWNDGAGDLSTITAVGGTMMLPNGTKVINIATDQLTGNFSPVTWSFAKGVGFTQLSVGSQTTNMTSFFVNTSTSRSITRQAQMTFKGGSRGLTTNQASQLLLQLF